MKTLKKILCLSLAVTVLCAVQPKKSEALIGVAVASVPLMVVGGLIGAYGIVTYATVAQDAKDSGILGALMVLLVGSEALDLGGLGLVLLNDSSHSATFEFKPLTAAQVNSMNVSQDELRSYGQDLEKINLVTASVTREALNYQMETHPSQEQMGSFIDSAWSTEGAALSTDDLSVMKKITTALNKKIAQAS